MIFKEPKLIANLLINRTECYRNRSDNQGFANTLAMIFFIYFNKNQCKELAELTQVIFKQELKILLTALIIQLIVNSNSL